MDSPPGEAKPTPPPPAPPLSNEQALLAFLRDRDAECPMCKYNVRNLTAPTCPECGTALVLGVHQADPFLRAWIIATVSASLAGGVGVLIVGVCIAERRIHPDALEFPASLSFFGSIAAAPLAVLLVIFRRLFLTRPRPLQWIATAAIAAMSAGVFVIFFCFMR